MKLFKNRKQNKGFTLVEILLVVGFIALAGIGIYMIYSKVQVSNQANQESRNLDTIRAGIKSLYGGNPNYSTLNNGVINKARITPESMRPDMTNDVINNTFGGDVQVAPGSEGANNNVFTITYNNVPNAVCAKLVSSAGVQFNKITINGTPVKEFGKNEPMNVAEVANQCNNTDDAVPIVFTSL